MQSIRESARLWRKKVKQNSLWSKMAGKKACNIRRAQRGQHQCQKEGVHPEFLWQNPQLHKSNGVGKHLLFEPFPRRDCWKTFFRPFARWSAVFLVDLSILVKEAIRFPSLLLFWCISFLEEPAVTAQPAHDRDLEETIDRIKRNEKKKTKAALRDWQIKANDCARASQSQMGCRKTWKTSRTTVAQAHERAKPSPRSQHNPSHLYTFFHSAGDRQAKREASRERKKATTGNRSSARAPS